MMVCPGTGSLRGAWCTIIHSLDENATDRVQGMADFQRSYSRLLEANALVESGLYARCATLVQIL